MMALVWTVTNSMLSWRCNYIMQLNLGWSVATAKKKTVAHTFCTCVCVWIKLCILHYSVFTDFITKPLSSICMTVCLSSLSDEVRYIVTKPLNQNFPCSHCCKVFNNFRKSTCSTVSRSTERIAKFVNLLSVKFRHCWPVYRYIILSFILENECSQPATEIDTVIRICSPTFKLGNMLVPPNDTSAWSTSWLWPIPCSNNIQGGCIPGPLLMATPGIR